MQSSNSDTTRRGSITRFIPVVVIAAVITLLPVNALAAVNYGAVIVDVMGSVTVSIRAKRATVPATVGQRLAVGDSIQTDKNAEAEILFDDGNVTRMAENSKVTIKRLSIEKNRSRKTVLALVFGLVKNSVIKLVHKESSFEVHTKSAVAGVMGTPEWIVGAFIKNGHTTEVDLLGEPGDKGSVFVQGSDVSRSEVFLSPGTRTTAALGSPPLAPFAITPDRKRRLIAVLPIKSPKKVMQEKREEILKKASEPATKKESTPSETDAMVDHLTRQISVGDIVVPTESETGEDTESQLALGNKQVSGASNSSAPINIETTIRINATFE